MSTPTEKPLNRIDHMSDKAREGAVTERHPSEDDKDTSYAPKQARERAGTDQHPVDNDRDPLRSPYAPPKARANMAFEKVAGPADPEAAASLKRAHPNSGHEQPAAERRDAIVGDHDFERLEASLRWLQRQDSATRLPRTTQLAPVPGLAPIDASSRRRSSELFGESFRSPRSLEPGRLAPPPAMWRRNIRATIGILAAFILGATIAYYFSMGRWAPPSEPTPESQTASFDPTVVAPPSWSTGQQTPGPTVAQDNDPATSAQSQVSSQRTKTSQPARSSGGETVAMLQPAEPGAQAPTTRALDPEEIKLLMNQGEQFIAAGDVVTARIVFQRAAEAGDADAAMALAATYDPIVLAKLGVVGLSADVEKARTWYQKAESLGSVEATRRLATLANR
jgi:hypothetical protein